MAGPNQVSGPRKVDGSPTVRFTSANEEIEPEPLEKNNASQTSATQEGDQNIKELSQSLQSSDLMERRMSHFAFEPVSGPPSRVSWTSIYLVVISIPDYTKDGEASHDFKRLYPSTATACDGRKLQAVPPR